MMLFRSFSAITAVLVATSPTAVTAGSFFKSTAGASIVEEQDTGVLHIHLFPELIERIKKDPSSHHKNVLAHFLADETGASEDHGARRTRYLKKKSNKANEKTTKSLKSSRLSAECRKDELIYDALFQFIFIGLITSIDLSFIFDYYIDDVTNNIACSLNDVGDTVICDSNLSVDESDFFFIDFNTTQCVVDDGGQVLNTTSTYEVLSNNVTYFTIKNLPYCIPTSCDPKTFVEYATDISSMKLTKSSKSHRNI
jgi:hypothetical protein